MKTNSTLIFPVLSNRQADQVLLALEERRVRPEAGHIVKGRCDAAIEAIQSALRRPGRRP